MLTVNRSSLIRLFNWGDEVYCDEGIHRYFELYRQSDLSCKLTAEAKIKVAEMFMNKHNVRKDYNLSNNDFTMLMAGIRSNFQLPAEMYLDLLKSSGLTGSSSMFCVYKNADNCEIVGFKDCISNKALNAVGIRFQEIDFIELIVSHAGDEKYLVDIGYRNIETDKLNKYSMEQCKVLHELRKFIRNK